MATGASEHARLSCSDLGHSRGLPYFANARGGYAFAIPHGIVTLWPPSGVNAGPATPHLHRAVRPVGGHPQRRGDAQQMAGYDTEVRERSRRAALEPIDADLAKIKAEHAPPPVS